VQAFFCAFFAELSVEVLVYSPVFALAPSPSSTVPSAGHPLRVLYADDMPELRDLLTVLIQREGHQVVTAVDGEAAWEICGADLTAFDLVITDHQMPRLNGLGFVEKLRAAGFGGKLMVFTSEPSEAVHAAYRRLGVDFILLKPIFPHMLRDALHALFPSTARSVRSA
jgi:CheY-like chemotaxis protein